ncbi:MAG: hypothetical protein AABX78_00385 [Nanoarchaeota archaeon]
MLSKNNIDKKLNKYMKEHLSKGYSKHAVKKVLVNHGYDEFYVDGLLKRHSESQIVKKYAVFVSLLFLISFFSFNFISIKQPQQIIGYVTTISSSNDGCCTSICQQTSKDECYGKFIVGKKCNELEECNVGCCIDKEGYCLTNYLYGNCISGNGFHINRDCGNIIFCRNLTDKSYTSRQYNIKNKKGAGITTVKPPADYQKSSFNIKYYLYDKTDVLSVAAELRDGENLVDSIALYDDGSHNDGAKDDNLYGNNWLSSKIKDFDGFKKLDMDIIVKYSDGEEQSISNASSLLVLGNNKCLPIYTEWDKPSERHSIIFAAQNYETDDGYQKFGTDVNNFLSVLFSTGKFSNNKDEFNFYRLEQSLSYFNIPTLINIASNFCPSYSNKKDLIILLDNNEDYCILENLRVVRVNPQVLLYKNITNAQINETFADFCSYVLTPKKLADEIIIFATPPKIVVNTLDNLTYITSIINLSFTVSALNYPINYSVFLENSLILNRISAEETTDSIVLNLTNGTNAILISSKDKNKNTAFSQLLLNITLQ